PAEAVDRAVQIDVLAAGHVGVESGPELEQRADTAADGDGAGRRLDDSRQEAQQRRLARSVAADEADGASRLAGDRAVAERPPVGASRVPAREQEVLERPILARVDAEAPRGVLDVDLAASHAGDGTASTRWTIPASVATNAGSSFG